MQRWFWATDVAGVRLFSMLDHFPAATSCYGWLPLTSFALPLHTRAEPNLNGPPQLKPRTRCQAVSVFLSPPGWRDSTFATMRPMIAWSKRVAQIYRPTELCGSGAIWKHLMGGHLPLSMFGPFRYAGALAPIGRA